MTRHPHYTKARKRAFVLLTTGEISMRRSWHVIKQRSVTVLSNDTGTALWKVTEHLCSRLAFYAMPVADTESTAAYYDDIAVECALGDRCHNRNFWPGPYPIVVKLAGFPPRTLHQFIMPLGYARTTKLDKDEYVFYRVDHYLQQTKHDNPAAVRQFMVSE